MLNIDQINQVGHLYYPQYRYRFPSIDFKFQNTGNATAFLWQFVVSVLSIEIDPTPVFEFHDFKVEIEDNSLEITATNSGWGTAHECFFQLDEPSLNLLFPDTVRQFKGVIPGGESQQILHLSYQHADLSKIEMIKKEFASILYYSDDLKYVPFPHCPFQKQLLA